MTQQELHDKHMRDYYELGQRRMQVHQLREALKRYGQHTGGCLGADSGGYCACGLALALHTGDGIEESLFYSASRRRNDDEVS